MWREEEKGWRKGDTQLLHYFSAWNTCPSVPTHSVFSWHSQRGHHLILDRCELNEFNKKALANPGHKAGFLACLAHCSGVAEYTVIPKSTLDPQWQECAGWVNKGRQKGKLGGFSFSLFIPHLSPFPAIRSSPSPWTRRTKPGLSVVH